MEQQRMVHTPGGVLVYTLRRKKIKNLNLRVEQDRTICLSVPMRCPLQRADQFVQEKSSWLLEALARLENRRRPLLPACSREKCLVLLRAALERVYPLVEPLGVVMPELKLRKMRSQWGNCHWTQGYITLNTALGRCPAELRDYVALHELVHFLHHDHGAGFYGTMDALMPDWRMRREELKGYSDAIERKQEGP